MQTTLHLSPLQLLGIHQAHHVSLYHHFHHHPCCQPVALSLHHSPMDTQTNSLSRTWPTSIGMAQHLVKPSMGLALRSIKASSASQVQED